MENRVGNAIEDCTSQDNISQNQNKPQIPSGLRQYTATSTSQTQPTRFSLSARWFAPSGVSEIDTLSLLWFLSSQRYRMLCLQQKNQGKKRGVGKAHPLCNNTGREATHITFAYFVFVTVSGWEMSSQCGQLLLRHVSTCGWGRPPRPQGLGQRRP